MSIWFLYLRPELWATIPSSSNIKLINSHRVMLHDWEIFSAEVRCWYWKNMASSDCLWRNRTIILLCVLAANDPTFCFWDDLDNSLLLQCSYNIGHYALLLKRLGSMFRCLSSVLFANFYVQCQHYESRHLFLED